MKETELQGDEKLDRRTEESRQESHGFLQAIALGQEVASLEIKRRTKDGRTLDVWLTTTKLTDEYGQPVAVATTERDITERKRHADDRPEGGDQRTLP